MRARWKLAAGLSSLAVGLLIVGHSPRVRSDSTDSSTSTPSSTSTAHDPYSRDPFAPYPMPGAIEFEQLSAADQAAVAHVLEVTDANHPPSSYEALMRAVEWTSADADRQIAARGVGLVDTADDGVVP